MANWQCNKLRQHLKSEVQSKQSAVNNITLQPREEACSQDSRMDEIIDEAVASCGFLELKEQQREIVKSF